MLYIIFVAMNQIMVSSLYRDLYVYVCMYYKSLVFEGQINYDKTDKQCGPLSHFYLRRQRRKQV